MRALGLPAPQYAHLSLIVGQGGAPLSKREGGGSLQELRVEGILPEALLNYLARLGHTYADNAFMGLPALAQGFDFSHLGHSPAHFDQQQLEHWQGEALRHADGTELWLWMSAAHPEMEQRVPTEMRTAFVDAVRGNLSRPGDGLLWARIVYDELPPASGDTGAALAAAGKGFFDKALDVFKAGAPEFKAYAKAVGTATGLAGKELFKPLRAALTGRLDGPEMERLWKLMPQERLEQRLRQASAHTKEP